MRLFAIIIALLLAFPAALHAQGIEQRDFQFQGDSAQAVINGVIAGRQRIDHGFDARRGQTVSVRFQPSNAAAFFDVIAPSGRALYVGQAQDSPGRFNAKLAETGEFAIRVYLRRDAARRGETSRFRLSVSLTGGTPPPPPPEEPFVEDDGGPDFYVVAGLRPGDRLNMRRDPSAASPALASFRNGTILRNLGCRRTAAQRWCNVEDPARRGRSGWANGRFLRESAAPDPREPVDPPAPRPDPETVELGGLRCQRLPAPQILQSHGAKRRSRPRSGARPAARRRRARLRFR